MLIRARIVLPLARPPIENGAILLAGKKILKIGRWSEFSPQERSSPFDLGQSILMPGLINAHCHLDYTDMAGKIPPPKSFVSWIMALIALKGATTNAEFAQSWRNGARMLLRNGTTTVADSESITELIPGCWKETPLQVISFRELISVRSAFKSQRELVSALEEWASLPAKRVGLSPHAPYTTSPLLLQLSTVAARKRGWPLSTHVAESQEEFDMFRNASGPLFEWLYPQRDMSDCGLGSPVQHLERWGYLQRNLLVIHANYLAPGDAALLARRKVSVVHCPRSHAYLRHQPFPYQTLAGLHVNLCLGTDSLASISASSDSPLELSLFREMQAMRRKLPNIASATLLDMVTRNPARALRRSDLGQLSPKARADLIAIPFTGAKSKILEAVVHHAGPVSAMMVGGKWLFMSG